MNQESAKKIKVLIVDDSNVTRNLFVGILERDPRFELVGLAANGKQAIEYVEQFNPDVVSMDIEMPVMDGIRATKHIMQHHPVPILIVSNLYKSDNVELSMEVLEAGALSIIPKPQGPGHSRYAYNIKQYLQMLKSLSEVKVVRRRNLMQSGTKNYTPPSLFVDADTERQERAINAGNIKVMLIGASAGGPDAIKSILSRLPESFPLPVLLVQHIDPHFAEAYRAWLQSNTAMSVQFATTDQVLLPGNVYMPPGDIHLVVASEDMATLSSEPPVKGHRPSISMLFQSARDVYCENIIAILLSGMGADGAIEMKLLRDCGALTIAQEEKSCLVFGMPGEAIKYGGARKVLTPKQIADELIELYKL